MTVRSPQILSLRVRGFQYTKAPWRVLIPPWAPYTLDEARGAPVRMLSVRRRSISSESESVSSSEEIPPMAPPLRTPRDAGAEMAVSSCAGEGQIRVQYAPKPVRRGRREGGLLLRQRRADYDLGLSKHVGFSKHLERWACQQQQQSQQQRLRQQRRRQQQAPHGCHGTSQISHVGAHPHARTWVQAATAGGTTCAR